MASDTPVKPDLVARILNAVETGGGAVGVASLAGQLGIGEDVLLRSMRRITQTPGIGKLIEVQGSQIRMTERAKRLTKVPFDDMKQFIESATKGRVIFDEDGIRLSKTPANAAGAVEDTRIRGPGRLKRVSPDRELATVSRTTAPAPDQGVSRGKELALRTTEKKAAKQASKKIGGKILRGVGKGLGVAAIAMLLYDLTVGRETAEDERAAGSVLGSVGVDPLERELVDQQALSAALAGEGALVGGGTRLAESLAGRAQQTLDLLGDEGLDQLRGMAQSRPYDPLVLAQIFGGGA